MNDDTRNVTDSLKGMPVNDIIQLLDEDKYPLEIAIENTLRDFNMGSIVRSANAFGVRTVHVVGRRQWNKRGAMKTDAYVHMVYHNEVSSLVEYAKQRSMLLIAIDNTDDATLMHSMRKRADSILLFGQEGPGLSQAALMAADAVVAIEQYGSTRSLNVAAAAAIAMYEWRHIIQNN